MRCRTRINIVVLAMVALIGVEARSQPTASPFLFVYAAPNPVAQSGFQSITVFGIFGVEDHSLDVRIVDLLGRTLLNLTDRLEIDRARNAATARFASAEIPPGAHLVCARAGRVTGVRLINVLAA